MVIPCALLITFRFLNPEMSHSAMLGLIAGSLTASVIQLAITNLAQVISNAKELGSFTYYISMPIAKLSLVLGLLTSALIQAIPGLISVYLAGNWLFGTWAWPPGSVYLFVLLLCLSLSSIGIAIGVSCRSSLQASAVAILASFVLTFVTPVFFPAENMPELLRYLSYLTPATYGAHGIRLGLLNMPNDAWLRDVGGLLIFLLVSLYFVSRRLSWRES